MSGPAPKPAEVAQGRAVRRWSYVSAGVVLVAFAALAWYGARRALAPVPPPLPDDVRDQAVIEALREARQAVLNDPYSGQAWGRLAEGFMAHGYVRQAMPCLEQADRRDTAEPAWPYFIALQRLDSDRADAVRYLRRAVERSAADPAARVTPALLLAEVLIENGEPAEARELCRDVLNDRPGDPHALLLLGLAAAASDEPAEALRLLSRAAAHPAARRTAYTQMAALHGRLGDEETARDFARRATQLPAGPSWPDPYLGRLRKVARGVLAQRNEADRYKTQHRPEDRIRTLEDLTAHTTDARAPTDLAMALNEQGDYAGAVRALQEAIRREPEQAQARMLLTITLFEYAEHLRGHPATAAQAPARYAEAAEAARAALRADPGRAPAHYFLGKALRCIDQSPAAIVALRQAVHLRPNEIAFRLELAEALAADHQVTAAIDELEQARSLAGDHAPLTQLLTRLRRQAAP